MNNVEQRLADLAVRVPNVLLPREGIDLKRWAVIACDQHTSDPEYWRRVEEFVGEEPSTLHTIFPEVYLEDSDSDQRIEHIRETMRRYIDERVFVEHEGTAVYLERRTASEHPRRGLMLAFDLERYDFSPDSESLIRATEETIIDRLPPRVRIRDGAPLELPHIMILIDDPEDRVFSGLGKRAGAGRPLYDTELMLGGGRVSGYPVKSAEDFSFLAEEFERLADPARMKERYGAEQPMLFAMGDGNHSFATAKQVWEGIKKREPDAAADREHPARYALAELVNLHDPALEFEPIHRIVFSADASALLDAAASSDVFTLERDVRPTTGESSLPPTDQITVYAEGRYHRLHLTEPEGTLAAAVLQRFIDRYLREATHGELDYIHGVSEVIRLADDRGAVGFLLPEFDKNALFSTVARSGPLPRKCFSLGEAHEKRYYLEARRIL